MNTDRELMQQALEALKNTQYGLADDEWDHWCGAAITALRERLAQPEPPPECKTEDEKTAFAFGWLKAMEAQRVAQPEQEPVAYRYKYPDGFWRFSNGERVNGSDWIKSQALYTNPPQRKPLPPQSPCEMTQAERKMFRLGWLECEAAHGIGEKPDAA